MRDTTAKVIRFRLTLHQRQSARTIEDDDLAEKLLRHPDVYIRGDAEEAKDAPIPAKADDKKEKDKEDDAQDSDLADDKGHSEPMPRHISMWILT